MKEQVLGCKKLRAITFCCSMSGDNSEIQTQNNNISAYAKRYGITISVMFQSNSRMDSFTYRNLRLRAKYHEFDVLLISELDSLGNSPIEIMQEINFLNENGVKVLSINDGELNSDTLPYIFRKGLKFVK